MRKLLALLVVGVIGLSIVAGMGAVHIQQLQGQLSEQTKAISQSYDAFVETHLTPLLGSANLTPDEQKLILQMHLATQAEAAGTPSVSARINAIHDTQSHLSFLLHALQAHQETANTRIASQLEAFMGKKSAIITQLDTYNETAMQWNDALASRTNVVWASLLGAAEKTLPYLRFDGEKEFFTTIQL